MIEFKLFGNWSRVENAIRHLPIPVMSAAMWGQRKVAERLVKIVKGHINNQDLGWPARSENTHSGDSRTLVDTEAYLHSIKAWRVAGVYYAGVKRTSFDGQGRRISDYAILHENGAPNLPARPLWGPSIKELGGSKGAKAIIVDAIYRKIQYLNTQGFDITIGRL